jgi:cysteinyl-tRNA synthetase
MIKKHLGETIDLHTGGIDLLFPHHENEIAQSQCCNGVTFSRHWYHTEHLLSEGTTMSKSKGNYHTLGDLVEKGYSPMAVRYVLLSGHPRKQLNFTLDSLHAAESALKALKRFSDALPGAGSAAGAAPSARFDPVFAALSDDLNTPSALGALFVAINALPPAEATSADKAAFDKVLFVLGLDLGGAPGAGARPAVPEAVASLAGRRWEAKRARDFATADRLRGEIASAGWSMLDGKDGYRLEPAKKA